MIMTALKIAVEAHAGQTDKAGVPYILHPIHVAYAMETEEAFAAALLHDVLEDSDYTTSDLRDAGIPENVLEALELLTHRKGTPYLEYIRALKENPIARAVKIADLAHNIDIERLPAVTERDLERVHKYKTAMTILNEVSQ